MSYINQLIGLRFIDNPNEKLLFYFNNRTFDIPREDREKVTSLTRVYGLSTILLFISTAWLILDQGKGLFPNIDYVSFSILAILACSVLSLIPPSIFISMKLKVYKSNRLSYLEFLRVKKNNETIACIERQKTALFVYLVGSLLLLLILTLTLPIFNLVSTLIKDWSKVYIITSNSTYLTTVICGPIIILFSFLTIYALIRIWNKKINACIYFSFSYSVLLINLFLLLSLSTNAPWILVGLASLFTIPLFYVWKLNEGKQLAQ